MKGGLEGRSRELAELLHRLFVNRCDDYALQLPSGQYVRANSEAGRRMREKLGLPSQLTVEVVERHLAGDVTVGVYPHDPATGLGKWGCLDLDEATSEDIERVWRVVEADEELRKAVLFEQSSPGRYHVWLLFEGEELGVIRWIMRRIVEKAGIPPRNVEVFPKQAVPAEFGNLVRLPLGVHRAKGVRSVFIDPKTGAVLEALEALRAVRPAVVAEEARERIRRELETEERAQEVFEELRDEELRIVEKAVLEGRPETVFCPALARAFRTRWKPGHRRTALSLIHAMLRGLGFSDKQRVRAMLKAINARFDPPLTDAEFRTWFEAEWARFGRDYSPPGCEIVKKGGGALFANLGTVELCRGCDAPKWVRHPLSYTAWRLRRLTARRVRLAEITARDVGRPLEAYAMVAGVTGVYRIPIGVELRADEAVRGDSEGVLREGVKISFRPDEQASFVGLSEGGQVRRALELALRKVCPGVKPSAAADKLRVKVRWGTAVEAYAVDVVDELRIDQASVTPRGVKIVMLREAPPQTGRRYILRGTAGVISRTSEVVFVASEVEEEEEAIDVEAVKTFADMGSAEEKVELLERICGGIDRRDMFTAIALTYFSPLYVEFKGRRRLAVLNTEVFGGTRGFKSEGAKRANRVLGGGLYVSLETGGRTGLLYTIVPLKGRGGYAVVWGELIAADRRLVIIDGANKMDREEWLEFRESRSDGIVKVRKAAKGDAWCRTRTILIRNPEGGRDLDSFLFKIEALSEYEPPDIARLDIIVPAETDIKRAKKVIKRRAYRPEEYADAVHAFREARKFIWRLRPEQVRFTPEAEAAVEELAEALLDEFEAKRYPLVSADADVKLAKLAAAWAALDGSFTPELDGVVVRGEHVRKAAEWWSRVLRKADLHVWARKERERRVIPPEELQKIVEEVSSDPVTAQLFELIAVGRVGRRTELASYVGLDEATVSRKIKILRRLKLVAYSRKKGYILTPRGIQVARAIFFEEEAEVEGSCRSGVSAASLAS